VLRVTFKRHWAILSAPYRIRNTLLLVAICIFCEDQF
jgi:hypothetical protein